MNAYLLALYANISFALGTLFFTHYSKKISSLWMNTFKALIAAGCFLIVILVTSGFHSIAATNFFIFFISGFIALGIGDMFLLNAFSLMGPGRTMVLFGFHPLMVGILSYLIFNQTLGGNKLFAIIFFILCLVIFSYENFKKHGHFDLRGIGFAFGGMLLDSIGVIITRYAFDQNHLITAYEGNLYRCIGALFAYVILSRFYKLDFMSHLKKMKPKSRAYVFLGAFLGTFLSLAFYLEAIKSAHLASVSAISITGVIFASFFECLWERKWPSKYLVFSLTFFGMGMYFLLFKS